MGTEESVDASPPAAESIPPAADSIPTCRSVPSIAQLPLPTTEAEDSGWGCTACGCTACGRVAQPLHRLKQDEAVSYFCSACILLLHKRMYCCLCFVVYENSVEQSDPALELTCIECQRVSHLSCAQDHNLPTDSALFTCGDCSRLEKVPTKDICTSTGAMAENGSPPHKKLRGASDDQISAKEALAAAHIVAYVTVKQAKDAKARARVLAGVSASAATRAKAALDTAHRAALEEARWKSESMKRFPGVLSTKHRGLPSFSVLNAPRISIADGRVSMPSPPQLHSYSLSHKHPSGKASTALGYTPRVSAPDNRIKAFPQSGDTRKSSPTSQNVLPKSVGFQKPQVMCLQERVKHSQLAESEAIAVSASPASILDGSSSPDTPHLNSSPSGAGPTCVILESSSMVLTGCDPSGRKSQLSIAKEQPLVFGKGAEDTSISAP